MAAIYLSEAEVAGLVDMATALDVVEQAHRAFARGELVDVPRERVRTGKTMLHMLMAAWPSRGVMGYKSYTSSPTGNRFWLHLFDAVDGRGLAVIEANALGMLRTAAASGVATRQLARADARCAGIIGAGWQAEGLIHAMLAVRKIEEFRVFARRQDVLSDFCKKMTRELGVPVVPALSAQAAVDSADIVVTATTSPKPVLEGAFLQPGMHINAVGSNALTRRELDEAAVQRAALIFVDSRASALNEAGDLLPLLDKGRLRETQLLELGDVLEGLRQGRESEEQITLFESQGMAIQDLALGIEVLLRAQQAGCGRALPY